jgi:ABC-type transport system substrate-binding protein
MSRRLALAIATFAVGAGLLAAAALGSSASTPLVLKIGLDGSLDSVDPAIADSKASWMLESATGATLYRYSKSSVVPEVARRLTVSKNGRVYRFFLRKGYRFSDGSPVRAASFAYAIKRSLSPHLSSQGAAFVTDPQGVSIVGGAAYHAGTASGVSGVSAKGLTLTIRLAHAEPALLTVLTMPFFQAASSKLSLATETVQVNRVGDLPTAGPFTWSYNNPDHQANLAKNSYYSGPRGRHVDEVEVDMELGSQTCFQETQADQLDLGCVPANRVADAAQQYGVSRSKPVGTGRFWVKSTPCESTVMFNFQRLFANNLPLRQAVSWAVDRTALAEQLNPYSVTPWTHVIPPGFPGVVTAKRSQPYSLRADLAKARQLAAGHMGDGSIRVAYQSAGRAGPATAEAVRQALVGLGFDQSRIEMRGYLGFDLYQALGTPGTTIDLAVGAGFCLPSSPDPASFIRVALDGYGAFGPANAAYNRAFHLLSRKLKGTARIRALGRFDVQMMKNLAPLAVLSDSNDLSFFSGRVDPASLQYSPAYGWNLAALRLR